MTTIGILISGRGSNMLAILDAVEARRIPARVGCVISNVEGAGGLARARDHGIDLARSWMIGDKAADVLCGRNAGTRTIFVLTGQGSEKDGAQADFIARDLAEAADFILKQSDAG